MSSSTVGHYELNEPRFLTLLTKLIGEAKTLQNQPPELIPVEDNAGRHVLAALEPYKVENGGVLKVEHVAYHEGRGNILIQYPGAVADKCISFVGSHLDVVPAIADNWKVDPFKLTIDGDRLYGRGTTDCLGHVALLTDLFIELATHKPTLKHSINAVFIASEENDEIPGVGVDELNKRGKIDHLKHGPLYWVDSADMQPTIGTGGAQNWNLKASGKIFHSALPHKSINSIELVTEALAVIQKRFYEDFKPHPEEHKYGYEVSSSMKPTLWKRIDGSYNQIPGEAVICGDIRLTPFYNMDEMRKKVESYVADINADINSLPSHGPFHKYSLPEEGLTGKVELEWIGESSPGVACNIDSTGYKALAQATNEVTGELKPVSTCGTLPLVKDLQDSGFDLQITGFGKEETYHGDNEYASLSDFKKAVKILTRTIDLLEN
ncbi:hypothetical protein SAMD00019534_023650 [Acytostelium subglobosum LB1]|uniref:hypothetical protein n=1 Tax=Acytostelium subglobosum LB1 TaxID=1410327 RepID=UPI000644A9E3|nr:hypothetical protein SAMD00019534_023650 [Acytostelium subglobosum LB1]GAM19190.1 hypothetical protein SAMD00019534_023650 [Acytostelium subglobosum LB1]|eukprot:XP_012757117.1 hypothetical protein SAMD00019534_023650 [Acytostelium subglobosum LB1]